MSPWVLLVIVAREFLVSGLRMVVASEGTVIAASNLGKWKTRNDGCHMAFVLTVIPQEPYRKVSVFFFRRLCGLPLL